jgi:hypothetical protein
MKFGKTIKLFLMDGDNKVFENSCVADPVVDFFPIPFKSFVID